MRSYPYAGARQRTARPRWRLHWWFAEDDRTLWQVGLPVPLAPDAVNERRAAYRALASEPPTHRGVFAMYLTADGGAVAEDPGAAAGTQSRFLLHAIPARTRDRPPDRRRAGCVNLDFQFDGQGAHCDGRCLAPARSARARSRLGWQNFLRGRRLWDGPARCAGAAIRFRCPALRPA